MVLGPASIIGDYVQQLKGMWLLERSHCS